MDLIQRSLEAVSDGAVLEVGPNVLAALLGALNVLQVALLAWLAYRYEQRGRERRHSPSTRRDRNG